MIVTLAKTMTIRQSATTNTICHSGTPPTLASVRSDIATSGYSSFYESVGGSAARDDILESSTRLPVLADAFYRPFEQYGTVPTAEGYAQAFYMINRISTLPDGESITIPAMGMASEFKDSDLKGRLCRAYPSFCRELDLLLQLWEELPPDYDAQYSSILDRQNVDILVTHGKATIGISSYLSSRRSIDFRQEKVGMRHAGDPFKPMFAESILCDMHDRGNCEMVGDVYLHTRSSVRELVSRIVSHQDQTHGSIPRIP